MGGVADMYRAWRGSPVNIPVDRRFRSVYGDAGAGDAGSYAQGAYNPITGNATQGEIPAGDGGPGYSLGTTADAGPDDTTVRGSYGNGNFAYGFGPGGQNSNPGAGMWNSGKPPAYTPGSNAYNYGGAPGGDAAWEQQDANLGQQYGNAAASQATNPYQQQQMTDLSNTTGNEQGLANYYQSIANGTGPNLAQKQMNASTDQSINAQMAMANSARGPLAAAGAQRQAAQAGVGMQQNASEQSAINTIQQQQMAAQAASGLYGQIGGQQLQQQGLSNQWGMGNAQLGEQQNSINAQSALGFQGLGQNVAQSQLAAQEQEQQANLQAAGLGQQQSQFQTQQNNQMLGTGLGVIGAFGAFADADFKEPGGGAAFTIREERGGPHHAPFLAVIDRTTGHAGKIAPAPLTPEEHAQLYAPHGAGPLSSPDRQRTMVHDMSVGMYGDGDVPKEGDRQEGDRRAREEHGEHEYERGIKEASNPANMAELSKMNPFIPARGGQPAYVLSPMGYVPANPNGPPPPRLPPPPMPPLPQASTPARPTFGDMDLSRGMYSDWADNVRGSLGSQGSDVAPQGPQAPYGLQFTPGATSGALGLSSAASQSVEGLPTARDYEISMGTPEQRAARKEITTVDPRTLSTMPVPQKAATAQASGAGSIPLGGAPARASWQSRIRPEEQGEIRAGERQQSEAMGDQERADLHASEDAAVAHGLRGQELQRQSDESAALEEKRAAEIDRVSAAKDAASLEAKKAGESFGYHPSAVQRMVGALAAALGAAGAGLNPHMQNYALQEINSSIDRDLERQKQEIESKKGRVSDLDSALASAYRRTGDMRQAMAVAHGQALQSLDEKASEYAQGHEADSIGANAKLVRGAFQEQKARQDAALYQHVVSGGSAGAQEAAKAYHKLVADAQLKPGAQVPTFPEFLKQWSGAGAVSASEKLGGPGAGKVSQKDAENVRAHEAALDSIDQILALRQKHGGGSLSPDDRAQAEALAARAQENLVAALGKTNKGLLDRTSKLIPEQPLELKASGLLGSDEIGTRLRTSRELLRGELQRVKEHPGGAAPSEPPEPDEP